MCEDNTKGHIFMAQSAQCRECGRERFVADILGIVFFQLFASLARLSSCIWPSVRERPHCEVSLQLPIVLLLDGGVSNRSVEKKI